MCFIKRIITLCVFLCSLGFPLENSLALSGLPQYGSSPARSLQPAFGLRFESLGNLSQQRYEAAGELGKGLFRAGFVFDHVVMDSLYRNSYSELDLGYSFAWFRAGAGYGASMEWIPGGDLWVRHRFKIGTAFEWRQMYIGGLLDGWFDDIKEIGFLVGGGAKVGDSFDLFLQWNGSLLDVGLNVMIGTVRVSSIYQFPGFGAEFSIGFSWNKWGLEVFYGFTNESFHGFGVKLSKRFGKKTIL